MARPKKTYDELEKELAAARVTITRLKSLPRNERYSVIIDELKKLNDELRDRAKDYRSENVKIKESRENWKAKCEELTHKLFMIKTDGSKL
jgi:DNA repair exonuclease SbcCD ATPase subunit